MTRGALKVLRDPELRQLANKTIADAIRVRGGGASQITEVAHMAQKSVAEVANLAAQGDEAAVTAIKIMKRAAKYAEKYGGK